MKKITFRKIAFVAVITLTLALIGCRTAPVYNVTDAPVNTATEKTTMVDIKKAIMSAGASLGWQMKEIKPGHIVGSLFLRKHSAVVDIPYTTKSYSINYKDSTELGYDGSNIHSNYNGWIQNLDRAIQARLSAM
jgi:PBP1b-binding outer membrane lipoprotein LpoB